MNKVFGLIIGLLAALGFVGHAAADYPVGTPTVTTSSSSPTAGSSVTLTANGFCANAVVVFTGGGKTLGQATASAAGSASLTITAPTTAGTFNVTATSSGTCSAVASLALSVQASGGSAIPVTGSDSGSGLQLGALAVGIGAALIGVASFRRRRTVAIA